MTEKIQNLNAVCRLDSNVLCSGGTILSFSKQYQNYCGGKQDRTKPLIVSATSDFLSFAEISDYPIVLKRSTILKVKKKHQISDSFLNDLPELLQGNVLIMESRTHSNSFVLVSDQFDENNNPIIFTLWSGKEMEHVLVNEVTSIYGRTQFQNFIQNTYFDGLSFYTNKKTEPWIKSIGLSFPQEIITALFTHYNTTYGTLCQDTFTSLDNKIQTARKKNAKEISIETSPGKNQKVILSFKNDLSRHKQR